MQPRVCQLALVCLLAARAGLATPAAPSEPRSEPGPAGPAGGRASSEARAAGRFYRRKAEGWFWYAIEVQRPAAGPKRAAPRPAPPAGASGPARPAPLSSAWLRANLPRYRDLAIDSPSETNVAAYLYLQKVALDKASRFAEVSARVVLADPYLDENTRRPTATFAANAMNAEAGRARAALLRRIARGVALIFFFRSDCPYCHLQAPVLEALERLYGFTVYPVSLDGRGLGDGRFPAFRADRGQARALGVVTVPALFLARPPAGIAPLGQGALSLAQLEERIVLAATRAGWVTEGEYRRTRPLGPGSPRLNLGATPGAVPLAPAALVAYLRRRALVE